MTQTFAAGRATSQASPLRSWRVLTCASITAAWGFVAFIFRDPLYDVVAVMSSTAILAAALLFLCWNPGPGRQSFRFVAFAVTAQTFVTSGLSIVQSVDGNGLLFTPTTEAFSFSVEVTTVFLGLYLLGAFLTAPRAHEVVALPEAPSAGPTPAVAVVLSVATALIALRFAVASDHVSRVGTLPLVVFNAGLLAPMFAAAYLVTRKRDRLFPLGLLLAGQAAVTLMNSSIGAVMVPVRDVLLAHVCLRRKLPRMVLVAGVLAVIILNPAKHAFRSRLANDGASHADDATQAMSLWRDAIEDTWQGKKGREDVDDNLRETAARLDYNWVAAHIYSFVPSRLSYEGGGTYADIPMVLVPRILYPDKPLSNTFTRSKWTVKLGLQSWERAERTAIAIPAPAEAYWNFGWAGVVLVPLVLGSAAGAMLRIAPRDPVARVGYVVLLASMMGAFMDMVIWMVPQFVVLAISAVLARLYCRVGRKSAGESRV